MPSLAPQVTVRAPGCIGNLGPGLDILGAAVTGPGDQVTARLVPETGIAILDPGHPDLPSDPSRHTSGIAAQAVLRRLGEHRGIRLEVRKELPLAGGQGGSAASAVAAAVAVNTLLGLPLDPAALLECCLEAETAVAGRHLDNVAPALLGGIVLVRSMEPVELVHLPVPDTLRFVLAHPHQRLQTRQGRAVLPALVPRDLAMHQAAQVAAITAALASGDLALLGRALEDRIAEPARAPLLPGFTEAKAAALATGALGCSISGSGPTAFAVVMDEETGEIVAAAMAAAYREYAGVGCTTRVARVDRFGAQVVRAGAA